MEIIPAATEEHVRAVRVLFREYAHFLDVDLCFQGFEEELAGLPGKYAAEGRCSWRWKDRTRRLRRAACARAWVCEMKRLFVRPAFRGRGLGRALADAILREGAERVHRHAAGHSPQSAGGHPPFARLGFRTAAPSIATRCPGYPMESN